MPDTKRKLTPEEYAQLMALLPEEARPETTASTIEAQMSKGADTGEVSDLTGDRLGSGNWFASYPHPWAALGARLASGALSFPGEFIGGGIAGGGETLAQLLEARKANEMNKTAITAEGLLGAIPFGKVIKAINPATSIAKQVLGNAARMGALNEVGNAIRRAASEHDLSALIPHTRTQALWDAGTTLGGMGLGAISGRFHATPPVEAQVAQDVTQATPRLNKAAVRDNVYMAPGEPKGVETVTPAEDPTRMGAFSAELDGAPEAPAVKAAKAKQGLRVIKNDKALAKKALPPEGDPNRLQAIREDLANSGEQAIEIGDINLAHNRKIQAAEEAAKALRIKNAEAINIAQQKAAEMQAKEGQAVNAAQDQAGTLLGKEGQAANAAQEQASTLLGKEGQAANVAQDLASKQAAAKAEMDALESGGATQRPRVISETSEKIPTASGNKTLRKSLVEKLDEEEGGGGEGIPIETPPISPENIPPHVDPKAVASTMYSTRAKALEAIATSGKRGVPDQLGRGKWRVVFTDALEQILAQPEKSLADRITENMAQKKAQGQPPLPPEPPAPTPMPPKGPVPKGGPTPSASAVPPIKGLLVKLQNSLEQDKLAQAGGMSPLAETKPGVPPSPKVPLESPVVPQEPPVVVGKGNPSALPVETPVEAPIAPKGKVSRQPKPEPPLVEQFPLQDIPPDQLGRLLENPDVVKRMQAADELVRRYGDQKLGPNIDPLVEKAKQLKGIGNAAPAAVPEPITSPKSQDTERIWNKVLADAKEQGYSGSTQELRDQFDQHVQSADSLIKDMQDISTHEDPTSLSLLKEIAKRGGLKLDKNDPFHGELAWLWEHSDSSGIVPGTTKNGRAFSRRLPSAAIAGVRDVLRQGSGLSADAMAEHLQQDPRFRNITDTNSLIDAIKNVHERYTNGIGDAIPTREQALEGSGVRLGEPWWKGGDKDISFDPEKLEAESQPADLQAEPEVANAKPNIAELKQNFDNLDKAYGDLKDKVKAGQATTADLRALGKQWGEAKYAHQQALLAENPATVPLVTPTPKVSTAKDSSSVLTSLPPDQQEAALKQIVDKFKNGPGKGKNPQAGFSTPVLLARVGLTSAGALIGAKVTPEDPLTGAMIGAGLGLYASSVIRALQNHLSTANLSPSARALSEQTLGNYIKDTVGNTLQLLPNYYRSALLANLQTLPVNALVGPYGSGLMMSVEHIGAGDPRGYKLLKLLANPFNQFTKEFFNSLGEGMQRVDMASERAESGAAPGLVSHMVNAPASAMTAGDVAIRRLAGQAGFSEAEARAYNLTSEPASATIKGVGNMRKTKVGPEGNQHTSLFLQLMVPFYRTNGNQIEQSMLRVPFIGPTLRKRWDLAPISARMQLTQQVMSGGIAGISGAIGYLMPKEYDRPMVKFINNFAGVYGTTAELAYMAGAAARDGGTLPQMGIAMAKRALQSDSPLPTNGGLFTDALKQGISLNAGAKTDIPAGIVPAILSSKNRLSIPTIMRDPEALNPFSNHVFQPTDTEHSIFVPPLTGPVPLKKPVVEVTPMSEAIKQYETKIRQMRAAQRAAEQRIVQ